jgi:hypothetical protein
MASQDADPLASNHASDSVEVSPELSRRGFLRLSGLSLLSLGLPLRWRRPHLELPEGPLARILDSSVETYAQPSFGAERAETFQFDDILPIEMAVIGDREPEHNRIWYKITGRGFLHSAGAQPVLNAPNPLHDLAERSAQLMEVTIPYVDAYLHPRATGDPSYRLYYATTHWISGSIQDEAANWWYRVTDPRVSFDYYALADAFRPILDDELTPISSDVHPSEKTVEVDLEKQWLKCFEGSRLRFMTRVSTGRTYDIGDFTTKPGLFPVVIKRSSRHMWVSPSQGGYDRPGVPWVSYFTWEGDALHGVYWHNDFGAPHSHGCVSMTPQAAKWIYRWTHPTVPADLMEVWFDDGTPIHIRS